MKKIVFLLVVIVLMIITIKAQETGTFKDSRNGKIYKTIKIGTEWIMAENLSYKPSSGNCWAYKNDESNIAKYSYLYDWDTAIKVAPKGWHLPTKLEWEILYKFLGNDSAKVYSSLKENGSSGFNVLLGGSLFNNGSFSSFNNLGLSTGFWSASSDKGKRAWVFECFDNFNFVKIYSHNCSCGYYIRLIRD